MYLYDKNRITYFAETDRRNKRVPFGIKAEDRTRHMYIIGKTGMGKSTLIENMVAQDIKNGEGFAFIDPHGKSAALLLDYIPADRVKDVVYFAPFDTDNPISFNVLEDVGPDKRHLVANGLMSAFKKIWGPETWSARMEYILMNTLLALLEYPDSTLLGVSRMLTDKIYRKKVVDNIKDPSVKAYWVDEFAKYSEQYAKEAVPGIQNKLGQFTSNPLIRNIIGQPHSSFDLRKMMDERKIFIVNLSKGQLGEGNANLLGGMIITKIYLAAMSRADLTESELKKLPNFYMYVDEFQSFANESFADILSEARKYKLALCVAHQYIKQMDEKVADAVFGNVGTQIMFRVGAPDAEVLEKEYAPVFLAEDMVSLGMYQIYLKLMIDGVASHSFSAATMGPIAPPVKSLREEVIKSSREVYGHPREEVEKNVALWYGASGEEPHTETTHRDSNLSKTPQNLNERHGSGTRNGSAIPQRSDNQPPQSNHTNTHQSHSSQDARQSGEISKMPSGTWRAKEPSSFVASRNDVATGDKTERANTPRQDPQRKDFSQKQTQQVSQNTKFEQPFARAFKDLSKKGGQEEVFKQKETNQPLGLPALLGKHRVESKGVFSAVKSKGPSVGNLNGLKSALAGVLETGKKDTVPLPQTQKVLDLEENKIKSPASLEQKKEDFRESKSEEHPKTKEVPEDILIAILRGDD